MNHYPDFVKYLVLSLILLHTSAGGHLFCCAHAHSLPLIPCADESCDHSLHQPPNDHPPACCCQDDSCDHQNLCNENEQLVVLALRNADEVAKNLSVPPSVFVSTVPVVYQPFLIGFRDTVAGNPSALPLRLHLLYGVLLI